MQFMCDAADPAWYHSEKIGLPPDVISAVNWCCQRSRAEARRARSRILRDLAEERRAIKASGELEAWFAGADPTLRKVAGSSCPPLMERLARRIEWHDAGVVEFYRQAARARRAERGATARVARVRR